MSLIRSVAKKVLSEMGSSLSYKVGTMIEIPRAALVADEVWQVELFLPCFMNAIYILKPSPPPPLVSLLSLLVH